MRKAGLLIWLVVLCLCPLSTEAHEGHDDQMGLDEAIKVGKTKIERLAEAGLINGSRKDSRKGRKCKHPHCKRILSIYNHEAYCHIHVMLQDRKIV